MFDLRFFTSLLSNNAAAIPNLRRGRKEEFYPAGLTMGTLVLGRQGSGKTTALARHVVEYMAAFPDRAIFVLDWSGSISDTILSLLLQKEEQTRAALLQRVVYDELGHPELVIPLPEFHDSYGNYEDQVQRVAGNLSKLAPYLVTGAPFLAGLGLREIAPNIFRLLIAAQNEYLETWQITEAKKLLTDPDTLTKVCRLYGYRAPQAKYFMEKIFHEWSANERDMRTYAIIGMLGAIEPKEVRARVGYYKPGWTPKEAIRKGQLVLVNGARLINQKNAQHYLFTQAYSLIMAEINKRTPADPADQPVALIMDEVYSLIQIPGMAEEIGMISPIYRSRKLEIYVVIQALWQLAENLRKQIWSLGNVMCFSVQDFTEAFEVAQQLFPYYPRTVKLPPQTETQHPLTEPDRGQYLQVTNWLQRLPFRACVMRRYRSEQHLDRQVLHVSRTQTVPAAPSPELLAQLKQRLLQERGVPLRSALEVINQRKLLIPQDRPRKV